MFVQNLVQRFGELQAHKKMLKVEE